MDSDASNFDSFQEESDAYSPEPKARAKTPKAPAKKAAGLKVGAKKTTQTTLTATKATPKKRLKMDSDDDDGMDGILDHTPPSAKKQKKAAKKSRGKPLTEIENDKTVLHDDIDEAPMPKSKKTATETYQKLTQLEHIIKRPDTYIGSVERTDQKMWVFNKSEGLMEFRSVSYVPGLYKIFDEILVNAADSKERDSSMTHLKVTIDRVTGEISVENNGKGIPVEMHEKEKMYIPEMIFGHLLTGSNYDDDEKKTVGGRNGYGAKLCNIFSTRFTLECQDKNKSKRYEQTWTDNMSKMGKARVTHQKTADFVKITFRPDFPRFQMDGIDDDLEALLYRRVYDMAGTVNKCKIYLNGEHINLDFKKYCELYAKAIARDRQDPVDNIDGKAPIASVIFEDPKAHARWQIGFTVSDGSFQQVSFVNNIATTVGGTHVNYIADQICDALLKDLNKKKKGHSLKMNHLRNHIFIFVNCRIINPAFNSQTKEQMTTKLSQFGSKCVLTDGFIKRIRQTEVIDNIMHFAEKKADKMLAKSDGNKRSRISNAKLVDANLAGTKHGHECTLILTEGDSAKALAVSGRAILDPDRIGVFPLRGKMLNVRDASLDNILKNQEIQLIKQFLGLKHKTNYQDTKSLRYGHLMIMADQDHDGSHIKGLLINFLECQFPSLLRIPDFFLEFITPVVKVWQGSNPKKPQNLKSFFTMPQYEAWKQAHQTELRKWHFKYYKGLGTSSNEDAQTYFNNLPDHLKGFHIMTPQESDLFDLAFSKTKADARKEWLGDFVPGTYLDHSTKSISYTDFINKELILFSMADNIRSIPSVLDGFKPGQRKVIFGCFKRNLIKDTKVVELAGYVSEQTAYHHGEASLQGTIVGLAQNFVGSNNCNILEPSGNFGSRLAGGKDSASARYIFTRLSPFARRIFPALDEPRLDFQYEDGKMIEPRTYMPVIPMVLVNGADGIGTGWSTFIPNFHPIDIVNNIRRRMGRHDPKDPEEKPFEAMVPWWRGWKGAVMPADPTHWKVNGVASVDDHKPHEVIITELPVKMWTDDFKAKLETIIRAEKSPSWIKDYKEFNDHKTVHFEIQLDDKNMEMAKKEGLLEKFKLLSQVATTNLVAFDGQGRIRKYENPQEIMEEHYGYRFSMYTERKAHWLGVYRRDLLKWRNQYRFVREIIDAKLVVYKKKKVVLVKELRDAKYDAIPPTTDRKVKSTDEELDADEEEQEDEDGVDSAKDFDYLLSMPIWSLTHERLERLWGLIAAKETEIEELEALSEKDLWCSDLDAFVEEWDNQMRLDAEIQKSIRKQGRRVSAKIGAGRGRPKAIKADDDYDPNAGTKAAKAAKPAPKSVPKVVEEKPSARFAEKFFDKAKPEPTENSFDGAGHDFSDHDFSTLGLTASKQTVASSEALVRGRTKRAAASKSKYVIESDEYDDDEFLSLGEDVKSEFSAPVSALDSGDFGEDNFEKPSKAPAAVAKEAAKRAPDSKAAAIPPDSDMSDVERPVGKKNVVKPVNRAFKSKPVPASDPDQSGSDAFMVVAKTKPAATKRWAAASKSKYVMDTSDDEYDDDDKMLGDVGALVKGIGGNGKNPSASNGARLSLFAMSRSDGQALPKTLKSKPSKTSFDIDSQDDTNYEALAMSSPRKSTKPDDLDHLISDEDSFPAVIKTTTARASASSAASSKLKGSSSLAPAPTKKKGRPAGSKSKSKEDKPAAAVSKSFASSISNPKQKSTTLSPAAKAYIAKKAKARALLDEADDEDKAVEMEDVSSPAPVPQPRGRPGRAAAAKAKPIIIDDEDDEDGSVVQEESVEESE